MTTTVGQLAWHVHHTMLCERLREPFHRRVEYIKEFKPAHEVALRLRLFKLVTGPLPKGLAVRAFIQEYYSDYGKYMRSLQDLYPQLQVLHATECPNCPWDGKTIFPGREL